MVVLMFMLLVVLVLASGCTTNTQSETTAPSTITSYTDVTVGEAKELINNGAVILDVRTPEEYNAGHIEGAVLIPHTELEERISEVRGGEVLIVYCRSGRRSEIASAILADNGFTNVNNMLGGINVWKAAGYPIE